MGLIVSFFIVAGLYYIAIISADKKKKDENTAFHTTIYLNQDGLMLLCKIAW